MAQINLNQNETRPIIRSTLKPQTPFEHTFTCNTGDVVPAFATIDIIPHDTWKFKPNVMVRLQSPTEHPTIGRAYWMWAAYYTPHIQVWKNWNALMGEVKDAAWVSPTTYTVPKIKITTAIAKGHILDHFGWNTQATMVNAELGQLKLRHYLHICNEWLRDQNVEAPIQFYDDETTVEYSNTGDWTVGGTTYKINRKADYFSTALPEPQRGEAVTLALGAQAPVIPTSEHANLDKINNNNNYGVTFATGTPWYSGTTQWKEATGSAPIGYGAGQSPNNTTSSFMKTVGSGTSTATTGVVPDNLIADLSESEALTINQLREDIVMQHIFELDARAGSRYPELLYARYGVEVDELELGRPRLLDSEQGMIGIQQVEQTSQTSENSALGDLGGFGYARNEGGWCTHSFKYHGCLMILFWIRTEHKYQFGVPREDMKFDRFDFWHPEMDGEGDQPIYMAEIYATYSNISQKTNNIWGYQQRGAEYKFFPSIITGELRSQYAQTLDSWTYADKYNEQPGLSNEWMKETPENVDRTIKVTSSVSDQWLVDFSLEMELTRAMRAYNIPGVDRI